MKLSLKAFALLLLAPVLASTVACNGDDASAPATDDTNEVNASHLQIFDCKTEREIDGALQHMTFSIKNITNNRAIEIFDKNGQDPADYNPVGVEPEGRVSSLNENLSVSTGTRQLRISGDSDGFYLLDLVLYKNSGYTKGYLRISGSDGDGGNAYSKVGCTVTER
jgi:hypothetical protein